MRSLTTVITLILLGACGYLWPAVAATAAVSDEDPPEITEAHEEMKTALDKLRAYHLESPRSFRHLDRSHETAKALLDIDRVRIGVVVSPERDEEHPGARIEAVTPGSPAEEAGLRAGDVITHVNGDALADEPDEVLLAVGRLIRKISALDDGDEVELELRRDGRAESATVVARQDESGFLGLEHGEPLLFYSTPGKKIELGRGLDLALPLGWLNMEMVALNPELGEYFGTEKGVLVVRGPEQEELDIRSGDVILEIDGRAVKSPSHAMRIMRSYEPNEIMSIRIIRHKAETTVDVSVPESQTFRYNFFGGSHLNKQIHEHSNEQLDLARPHDHNQS